MNYRERIYNILVEKCLDCRTDAEKAAKDEKNPNKKQVAYNKARREAENKRHGKEGESPRDTQVRRHGGGGMAARRSPGLGATTPRRRPRG